MTDVEVREATPEDLLGVRRVLDAAMLAVRDDLRERIATGDVLIASEVFGTSKSRAVSSRATRGKARKTSEASLSAKPRDEDDSGSILGALVLVPRGEMADEETTRERGAYGDEPGARVDAVAVRRARRGQGIGSALVRAASERHPRITAEFDASVRPFYESLEFEIEPVEEGADRFRGRYERGEE